jgi:hydroxymethylbilane synthase
VSTGRSGVIGVAGRAPVRIATRGSDLALWQARTVARSLEHALGCETEIVPLSTKGDRLTGSLSKVGGKGLFVAEIEAAVLDGRADLAVHSGKDLPAETHPELVLAAFPERADPRDALCGASPDASLAALPPGARVGTGSARRTAQLRRLRPDLEIVPLRGNVPTRLRKREEEGLAAVVLACAGLDRLSLGSHVSERIAPEALLPSVAQGAMAVQARRDGPLAKDLARIDHPETAARVAAERAFLRDLGGDCNVPIAGFATIEEGTLHLRGMVLAPDGSRAVVAEATVPEAEAARAGVEVARRVLAEGGAGILAGLRGQA